MVLVGSCVYWPKNINFREEQSSKVSRDFKVKETIFYYCDRRWKLVSSLRTWNKCPDNGMAPFGYPVKEESEDDDICWESYGQRLVGCRGLHSGWISWTWADIKCCLPCTDNFEAPSCIAGETPINIINPATRYRGLTTRVTEEIGTFRVGNSPTRPLQSRHDTLRLQFFGSVKEYLWRQRYETFEDNWRKVRQKDREAGRDFYVTGIVNFAEWWGKMCSKKWKVPE